MSETGVWTVVHGMVFGGIFLLGFSAGFVADSIEPKFNSVY